MVQVPLVALEDWFGDFLRTQDRACFRPRDEEAEVALTVLDRALGVVLGPQPLEIALHPRGPACRHGARPRAPAAGTGAGARIERISVKYFMWSRRVRVAWSAKQSSLAKGFATKSARSSRARSGAVAAGDRALASRAAPRLQKALPLVDRPRLLASFVDREHEAAVQELFVHLGRGGRQKDHHWALAPRPITASGQTSS